MATQHSNRRSHNFKDLTGKQIGSWTILGLHSTEGGRTIWLCRCRCGTEKPLYSDNLRHANRNGCRVCYAKSYHVLHKAEYAAWNHMLVRCRNNRKWEYHRYGGRGIRVCRRWMRFNNFFDDIGARPSSKHSIDRIDNNGHYSCGNCEECRRNGWPANCRWATRKEQQRNTSFNRVLTHNGETKCLAEWCEEYGISMSMLRHRLRRGWSPEKALTTPPIPRNERWCK